MTTAERAEGPWEPAHLVKPARGLIDACPLWDDDGRMYVVHAWAKSRAGFNAVLTVLELSPDGRRVIGEGRTVFEGGTKHFTIEGPKLYKRDGWYWIFAPAGGVKTGWQVALRSRSVYGPYEDRIVLAQGRTAVNGPHQGAWVDAPDGSDWFLHFQDRGAYGRVVHLQPMRWKDGWPVMGADPDGDGTGEPVASSRKPTAGEPPREPQTSEEFDGPAPGLQWQWQSNPDPSWWSIVDGALRLSAVPAAARGDTLWAAGHLLLQKLPAPAFVATTLVRPESLREGEEAGLVVMGRDYAALVVSPRGDGVRLALRVCAEGRRLGDRSRGGGARGRIGPDRAPRRCGGGGDLPFQRPSRRQILRADRGGAHRSRGAVDRGEGRGLRPRAAPSGHDGLGPRRLVPCREGRAPQVSLEDELHADLGAPRVVSASIILRGPRSVVSSAP